MTDTKYTVVVTVIFVEVVLWIPPFIILIHKKGENFMESIIIFGSGGQAKVIIDIIEKEGMYKIHGLIDENRPVGFEVLGYKVLGGKSYIKERPYLWKGIVAVGDNWKRFIKSKEITLMFPNFKFIKAIHPCAFVGKDVYIGDGTVVMANAVINTQTNIGEHCIINTNSSVDHDGELGNFVSVAPGATIGGNVSIGDYSFVSLGAKIIHNITIGKHTVIGAGSTVVKDLPSKVVAYGSPSKIIRSREVDEKYL